MKTFTSIFVDFIAIKILLLFALTIAECFRYRFERYHKFHCTNPYLVNRGVTYWSEIKIMVRIDFRDILVGVFHLCFFFFSFLFFLMLYIIKKLYRTVNCVSCSVFTCVPGSKAVIVLNVACIYVKCTIPASLCTSIETVLSV